MKDAEINQSSIKKLGTSKRKVVSISQEDLVKTEYLETGQLLPVIVQPSIKGLNLANWAEKQSTVYRDQFTQAWRHSFPEFSGEWGF
jgi:hypothetical protein